jgi:hypothetical protein
LCAALRPSVAGVVHRFPGGVFSGSVMLGEFVTFLHRNARTVILATPALVIATGALLEGGRFFH